MKEKLYLLLCLPGIIAVCAVGGLADLFGAEKLARWCERELMDTDGQPEDH